MVTIEKAGAGDFGRIYPLLRQCFGDALSAEEWKKIFAERWRSPEDFCGYMLSSDGEVKGYLGLLFSRRPFDGRVEKFCNMTSWCVSEEWRAQSLSMLLAALKLKEYTFTNFTASPAVAAILSRLGFKEFEVHQQVLFPVPSFRGRGCTLEFDPEKIRGHLDENDRVILDDHREFDCLHLLLRSGADYSYVILKKTWRKHLPFAKVQYLSRVENFVECVEGSMASICLRLRVLGLMIDERYLKGHRFRAAVRYPHQRKAYFKSGSDGFDVTQLDTLYSEVVVLHS